MELRPELGFESPIIPRLSVPLVVLTLAEPNYEHFVVRVQVLAGVQFPL